LVFTKVFECYGPFALVLSQLAQRVGRLENHVPLVFWSQDATGELLCGISRKEWTQPEAAKVSRVKEVVEERQLRTLSVKFLKTSIDPLQRLQDPEPYGERRARKALLTADEP